MSKTNGLCYHTTFQQILDWYPDLPAAIQTPVHNLIHISSKRRPESLAIHSWDGDFSYGELDDISSRLASYIMEQGVTAEVIVPLVFEKSKWMIVSLLAVLKAGGTFLMLDPSQPVARLQIIVQQTKARFAIVSKDCLDMTRLFVDNIFVLSGSSLEELPDIISFLPQVEPSTSAYTIFTSGSTGTPKGVVIEHAQLATTSTYVGERLGYDTRSRVYQFASYAFDASITDIIPTLVHGGTICIPSEWERNNAIIDSMNRMKVTLAKFTPSLAGNLELQDVPTLRTLTFGGESPPITLVEKWASKLELILVYGPTECCVICFTTDASHHDITPGEIGRPVAARGWIVKQGNHHALAAIGEVGELLIEGPLVGRGYMDDSEKTSQQFISNPEWMPAAYVEGKVRRLYRTGDLARYLPDGRVCYVGRVDNQVKIRGQRLELEEVEKHLGRCVASNGLQVTSVIAEALTFKILTAKHLVAFLCCTDDDTYGSLEWDDHEPSIITSREKRQEFAALVVKIKDDMAKVLPAYAVPTLWIPVKAFPYTISRKIDRKRLRNSASQFSVKEIGTFAHPPTEILAEGASLNRPEQYSKLRELWADTFDISESTIEPTDDFFSIGGDSVLAIKMIAAARTQGLDLSLQLIFRHPTLSDMAASTGKLDTVDDISEVAPFSLLNSSWDVSCICREASEQCAISMESIEDIYPCSPMQEGLMALSMKDPGTYILQFVYQTPASVDLEKLKFAWETVARQTQVMRTRFFDYNSHLLQAVIKEPLRWQIVEGNFAEFLVAEKEVKMNIGESMSRHAVVRQPSTQQYFLVWNVQHALIDGWSESDIVTLVEQAYFGDTSNLETTPEFGRFIKYLGTQNHVVSKRFWQEDLTDAPTPVFPPLPDDNYVPKVQRSSRILHHFESHADAEVEHKFKLLKSSSATPATMIQAAWFILMGLYSDSNDVITGVTLNGRAAPLTGIDRIPGPTVTTIPFRARFVPDEPVQEFLQRIQTQYLNILPHVQYGLQNIRALGGDAVNACKFRTLLIVQSANRPHSSRKVLLGRSYSFPVMDFALVTECEVVDGSVEFRATFDHQILCENQVRQMLGLMESILQKISCSEASTPVSQLQIVSEEDQTEISHWHQKMRENMGSSSQQQANASGQPGRVPSTDVEKSLAKIWQTLLQVDDVRASDNFFLIGGGSVSAMRLVSLARREGLILTVRQIFQAPILYELARAAKTKTSVDSLKPFSLLHNSDIDEVRRHAALQCGVTVDKIEDVYPVHAMQLHYITGYPENKRHISGPWDWQSQTVYKVSPELDLGRLQSVWHQLVQRHQALRTRAVLIGNEVLQAVLKPPSHLDWRRSIDLEAYKQADRSSSMTFGDDLLRLAIVEDPVLGRNFVITLQHFIYDGFARQMLFKELETAYFDGPITTRPPQMNQLIKYITTADKDAALAYWKSYLSEVETKPLLNVPEHIYQMNPREETCVTPIPKISGTHATLPTIIEVVGALVISCMLGCRDIILYSDRSGRNLPVEGIQDLIGPATLFLPVRIRRDAGQPLRELLCQAQDAQRDMLPHEHLGWLELREMAPFRPFYRAAVNMNINPNAVSSCERLGLEYRGSYASVDDPFGINVDLYDDRIVWNIYYDDRFISRDDVLQLLTSLDSLLRAIPQGLVDNLTVGKLLEHASG